MTRIHNIFPVVLRQHPIRGTLLGHKICTARRHDVRILVRLHDWLPSFIRGGQVTVGLGVFD